MKDILYTSSHNLKFTPGSFRACYKTVYGTRPFPVDRFNLVQHIAPDAVPAVNILKEPVYNLSNLTSDWEDRYWAICDQVADSVYTVAENTNRAITVMYSGGIDSAVVLVAMMQNPRYREFLDQGRLSVGMTSTSIQEYPEFFYNRILPEIPIKVADYCKEMADPTTLVVTGDAGDYVIGNTDTPIFFHNDSTDNLYEHKSALTPYFNQLDPSGQFADMTEIICRYAPFDIVSVNQLYWWIGQCFVHQGEMCYPYIWSTINDISELNSNTKIFRFFADDRFMTYSFEYMSTNPRYTNFNSVRDIPRNYIVNYTKDQSYLTKIKIFSQRLMIKPQYKNIIYRDLSHSMNPINIIT